MADKLTTMQKIESSLELYLHKKAPALPKGAKEFLVKLVPYVVIITVVLTLPAILLLLGLDSLVTLFAPLGGPQSMAEVPNIWIITLLLIPVVILQAMAIPGLFSHKETAWRYLYWAELISIVSGLAQLNVGHLIGAAISLYLLFQIRSYYK